MQKYAALLESMIQALAEADISAVIGFLPPAGGLALSYSGGDLRKDFAGNRYGRLRITIAAKSTSQSSAIAQLDAAQTALGGTTASGTGWQISGVAIGTPQLAGQDAQGNYIFSSVLQLHVFVDHDTENPEIAIVWHTRTPNAAGGVTLTIGS